MPHVPRLVASGVLVALVITSLAPRALPDSSLEGKELPIANEIQSGLESAAGSLLAGDLKGMVTRAVVTSDQPLRLVVRVSYDGFQGARMWAEALSSDRKRQAWITSTAVDVTQPSGDLEFTLEPRPGSATDRLPVSSQLRILVAPPGRATASYRRSFELSKSWTPVAAATDESFSVTITPEPVGHTAELGPTPSMVVPPGAVRIAVTPATLSAPTAAATPRIATPTARVATRSISGTSSTTPARSITRSIQMAAPSPPNPAAQALPPSKLLLGITAFQFGLRTQDAASGARGPAAFPPPIRPFGDVRTEDIDLDLTRVLNMYPEVYPDQTASTGIYYFLPQTYSLKWDETAGYEFKTLYSAAGAGGAGEVLMAARLESGVGPTEQQVASDIVRAYTQTNNLPFRELRPLAIDTLWVSLSDDLGRYSIPANRVTVHGLSEVLGQLDVSWVTDERTKDFVQEALVEDVGINGAVTFSPSGGGLGPRTVQARMLLADYGTFGPFRWNRREPWRNRTPYPITLRYLHALRVVPGSPPVVHTWSLGDTRVPPGGQVKWNSSRVPFWIDGQARKMWLDYSVDRSCDACDARVIAALTGGVSRTGASQITFHTMTPLADAGAYEITLEVRSRYFDPRVRDSQVRQLVLDSDGKDFSLGPLFPGDRQPGESIPGDPLFEYRLGLTMKDGRTFRGSYQWVPSDDLRVPIGRFQLESSLGSLPEH